MAFDADVFGTPPGAKPAVDADVFGAQDKPLKMEAVKPKGTGSAALDMANAAGTGLYRAIVRTAGLPADTLQNVIDLGKAGLGSAYAITTGKRPPEALEIDERSNRPLTGDWFLKHLGQTKVGDYFLNPVNPDYEGGYAQAAGGGLLAVMSPNNARQALNQAALGVTGALSGKAAMDMTGNPALGVAASLTPSGVQQAGSRIGKAAIIGANPLSDKSMAAAEARVADRITALRNAGVENPTMGLATGNRFIGGLENILQSSPGAINVMAAARQKALDGLNAKSLEAADLAAQNRGTTATGQGIQTGLGKTFADSIKAKTGNLYDVLDQHIDAQQPTLVTTTLGKLDELTQPIQGAPNVSQRFINGTIKGLRDDFRADTAGAPATVMVVPQPPKAGGGIMNAPVPQPPLQVQIPASPPTNSLPWQAVKQTRTMVGTNLSDGLLATGVPDRQWRALYGSLSEDMGNAARSTSPAAEGAFNRATNYNRAAMGRLERVAPFANAGSPEAAFNKFVDAANERGSLSTLQAVKKSLPQDVRGQVAGTVIERLGKATNGAQNAEGTAWSPETFLTNWNKMSPAARDELFSGFKNAAEVKASVESVAKATDMMRQTSKMWANPSGTVANLAARGLIYGGSALGLLNPLIPVGVGAYMGGNRVAAGLLTDRNFVNAMGQRTYVSPQQLGAQGVGLLSSGVLEGR